MIKYFTVIFFSLIALYTSAQTLTGVVSDTLNKPLENANVIAKPLQEKATLQFSIVGMKNR